MRWFSLCCLVLAAACTRQGPPSEHYAEAHREFVALYGKHLEDAYLLPEMAAIEAKLEQVPENSSDANEAQSLLKRIRSGRERREAQLAEREEAVREARTLPPGSSRFEAAPSPPPSETAATAQDAGTDAGTEGGQPAVGMAISELTRRFGDCFLAGERIRVAERGERPTWKLRETLFCQQRHPGFDNQLLVEEDGKILAIVQRAQVQYGDAGS